MYTQAEHSMVASQGPHPPQTWREPLTPPSCAILQLVLLLCLPPVKTSGCICKTGSHFPMNRTIIPLSHLRENIAMTSVSPVTRRLTPVKGLLLRWFACFYEGPITVRTLIVTRRSLEFLSTRGCLLSSLTMHLLKNLGYLWC